MIPEAIHAAIRNSQAGAPYSPEDNAVFFWVEWNQDDDQIPAQCEAILKTGQLAADWDDETLVIVWRGVRFPVPLTKSPLTTLAAWAWPVTSALDAVLPFSLSDALLWPSRGDRHITLLALNRALSTDYEIRYVRASGDDEPAFAPLAAGDWATLEQQYGPDAVEAAFARLRADQNLFTGSAERPAI